MTSPSTGPIALSIDAHGRLALSLPGGERIDDLTPLRCFPLTDGGGWIALVDPSGRERFLVERLDQLDQASRAVLAAELARREFVPRIVRVVDVRPRSEPSTWTVETDRGPASFVLPGEDAIRRLGPEEALITDGSGVRWRLSSIGALDRRSRAILRRYL